MTRPTRGLLAQISVVLAIVALASIALAPRGMVRAAVADDLDLPAAALDDSPSVHTPAAAVQLPGVRALVSREEQDPHEALLDALSMRLLPGASLDRPGSLSVTVDTALAPPASAAPSSTNGDRAPPSSI